MHKSAKKSQLCNRGSRLSENASAKFSEIAAFLAQARYSPLSENASDKFGHFYVFINKLISGM